MGKNCPDHVTTVTNLDFNLRVMEFHAGWRMGSGMM